MRYWRQFLLVFILLPGGCGAAGLQIRDVRHDRNYVDTGRNEQLTVRFTLSEPARTTLNIFDGRDLLIRAIESQSVLTKGSQKHLWDGNDQAGRPVPAGAYHYTLVAIDATDRKVEYDLTDLTGGEDLVVKDVRWDRDTGLINYVLDHMARVSIRLGLQEGGPLLRTLIDWVPRTGGAQSERWDGMDQSGVLDLSKHPGLSVVIKAFALSDNTIIVGPNVDVNRLVQDFSWGSIRREVKRQANKRMYAHAQQSLESRGDFTISLKLPEGIRRNSEGISQVSGRVAVRLDIDDSDRVRALARRFEPVFFVDGIYVFENETGFLPMTWNWDASSVNPGTHYLTANLRGYEGNFGMATVRVEVVKEQKANAN